jgi:hypothetical protein
MSEQVLEIPFDNINQRQCYEIVGCAGEVVANAFAVGVPTLEVKVGSRRDPGNGIEEFAPGLVNAANNGVSLRTESLGDISGGRSPAEFNPFKQTFWPLTINQVPPTVEQVLFPVNDRIPAYVQLASPGLFNLEIAPTASYFLVRNWVANMYGLIMARGGTRQWFGMCQALENNKRRYFLMFSRVPQLNGKDVERISMGESCYLPSWMLGDVLAGVHKQDRGHGNMGDA